MDSSALEMLRRQMREKFPSAHGVTVAPEFMAPVESPFDLGNFPKGAITEVVPAGPFSGLSLLVAGLLGEPEETSPFPCMVLVDGGDSFDPDSFSGKACSQMLWVRCRSALEMIKAADLLVNDGNMPLVLLDALGLEKRDLMSIPASAWWRIRQTAERKSGKVILLAPFPLVPCASIRLSLSADLCLGDFDLFRDELLERLHVHREKLRRAT